MFRGIARHIPLINRTYRPSAAAIVILMTSLLSAANSAATPITRTLDFTASNFRSFNAPAAAPVDPVIGSITITFDPGLLVYHASSITVNRLNIQVGFPVVFDYSPTSHQLFIAGDLTGNPSVSLGVTTNTNNFLAGFSHASSNPTLDFFTYAVSGVFDLYAASSLSVSVIVGEPTSLALLVMSIGTLLGVRRRAVNHIL